MYTWYIKCAILTILKHFLKDFLFIRECEREVEIEAEGEGQAGLVLSMEPHVGLDQTTLRS